jgi:hypothetical protein
VIPPLLVPLATLTGAMAVPIPVTVVDPQGVRVQGEVSAAPLGALDAGVTPVLARTSGGTAILALAPGVWALRAAAPERWGEPVQVSVPSDAPAPAGVQLTLWPLGRVHGTLRVPAGEHVPDHVTLGVWRGLRPEHFARAHPLDAIVCPVRERRWACDVPAATPLDLRLDTSSFAPRYLWRVTVGAGQALDAGEVSLFRGASLTGFVVASEGRPWSSPPVIRLTATDGAPIRTDDAHRYRFSAPADALGFFQVGPVAAGTYHVAAAAGSDVSDHARVTLVADEEERVFAPLELRPPAILRVAVEPPLDPRGRAWRLRLLTSRGPHSGHLLVRDARVSEHGTWSLAHLPASAYELSLTDADGAIWHNAQLDLQPGVGVERIAIRLLNVEGRVAVGERPFTGRVKLIDHAGRVHATFVTDEQGAFAGHFPSVDLEAARWGAELESAAPRVRRTLWDVQPERTADARLSFDLTLSGGSIEGVVVDERGAPRAALVQAREHAVTRAAGGAASRIDAFASGADGRFELAGLEPGEYHVHAAIGADAGFETMSDVVSVQASAGRPARVRLVLKSTLVVIGRVTTPSGAALPGVTVSVVPADFPDLPARVRTTDAEGRFDVRLPEGTQHVHVNAWANGVGRRLMGRGLTPDRRLDFEIDPSAGGLLVFDFAQAEPDLASAYVFHDGGFVGLAPLAHWGRLHGEGAAAGVLRVPLMAPGEYRVCRLFSFADYIAAAAGGLPAARCQAGRLPAGGELRLVVPSAARPPAPAPSDGAGG